MEEAPFLLPMHRIVGRIEIENDLARRVLVRLQEQIDKQSLDGDRVVTGPVIARRLRHRRAILAPCRKLARQHCHHRIVAQLIVVVEVLIAERDPEHSLAHQRHHLVLDQILTPHIVKARRKPLRQPDRMIRRSKKQRSRIRRDRAAVECRHHFAPLRQRLFAAARASQWIVRLGQYGSSRVASYSL
jgi:hypothetical protein